MKKYTQRELKNLITNNNATDITNGTNETRKEIQAKEGYYTQTGYSAGVYGCNGMLLQGNKTGELYVIVARTQAIYIF